MQEIAPNVHKCILNIENLHLIEIVADTQDQINKIIDFRKKDGDRLLTDQQKEKLRHIKCILRQGNSPFLRVVTFYHQLDNEVKNFQTKPKCKNEIKKYLKERYQTAQKIKKAS